MTHDYLNLIIWKAQHITLKYYVFVFHIFKNLNNYIMLFWLKMNEYKVKNLKS